MSKFFPTLLFILLLSACSKDKDKLKDTVDIFSVETENLEADSYLADKNYSTTAADRFLASNSRFFGDIRFKDNLRKLKRKKTKYSKAKTDLPFAIAPTINDKQLFIADRKGEITAIDLETRKKLWRTKLKIASHEINHLSGGIVTDDDYLYVTNGSNYLFVLAQVDGSIKWQKDLGFIVRAKPFIHQNKIYVKTIDERIFAFGKESGNLVWLNELNNSGISLYGNSSFSAYEKVLVSGSSNGDLIAFEAATGKIIWQDSLLSSNAKSENFDFNDIKTTPLIYQKDLYAVSNQGFLAKYDVLSGIKKWDLKLSSAEQFWLTEQLLLIIDNFNNLVAVDTASGQVKWLSKLTDYAKKDKKLNFYGPMVAGGQVLAISNKGKLLSFAYSSGEYQGKKRIAKNVNLVPLINNEQLYLFNNKGKLYNYYFKK